MVNQNIGSSQPCSAVIVSLRLPSTLSTTLSFAGIEESVGRQA